MYPCRSISAVMLPLVMRIALGFFSGFSLNWYSPCPSRAASCAKLGGAVSKISACACVSSGGSSSAQSLLSNSPFRVMRTRRESLPHGSTSIFSVSCCQ